MYASEAIGYADLCKVIFQKAVFVVWKYEIGLIADFEARR
jgi:hypothetical protein